MQKRLSNVELKSVIRAVDCHRSWQYNDGYVICESTLATSEAIIKCLYAEKGILPDEKYITMAGHFLIGYTQFFLLVFTDKVEVHDGISKTFVFRASDLVGILGCIEKNFTVSNHG